MDRRKGLMGHMEAGLNRDTRLTWMTQSEMVNTCILLIGRVMIVGSILVMVERDIIVITATIHIGGVRSNTCEKFSRKKSLLHLMEK